METLTWCSSIEDHIVKVKAENVMLGVLKGSILSLMLDLPMTLIGQNQHG